MVSYTYTTFGVDTTFPASKQPYVKNPYRYNGEYIDFIHGAPDLQYLRARYYDAAEGRFTTRDTVWGKIEVPLSQNLYVYVGNNQVNCIDPSGHRAVGFNNWNLPVDRGTHISQDHSYDGESTKYITSYLSSTWDKLSNSDTSVKVLRQIELAIHNSYVADCSAWSMTKDEYFAKVTGYQISSIGFLSQLDKIKEWAWESVKDILDALVDKISYQNPFFLNVHTYLKYNTKSYQLQQQYEKLISDLGTNGMLVSLADMVLAGFNAYGTGADKIEAALTAVMTAVPSPEPGPLGFIHDKFIKDKDIKKAGVSKELAETVGNSAIGYFAFSDIVRNIFIEEIEKKQNEIALRETTSFYGDVYNTYTQYYLETVKLVNLNGVDKVNKEVDDLRKSIEYKWNNF